VGTRGAFFCGEGELFIFEGKGEAEDEFADGYAKGQFVGVRIAGNPEFAGDTPNVIDVNLSIASID